MTKKLTKEDFIRIHTIADNSCENCKNCIYIELPVDDFFCTKNSKIENLKKDLICSEWEG